MSSSKNLEYKKTSFLNKSNSAFIEQMYVKYVKNDPNLPESWKKYFLDIGDDINCKELLKNVGLAACPNDSHNTIKEIDNIEIKPSMIQPIKEIKSIGNYKVKITLHSDVDAEISLKVETSESI